LDIHDFNFKDYKGVSNIYVTIVITTLDWLKND
jgi:hypothetical protein